MILTPDQMPIGLYHGAEGAPRWLSKTSLNKYKTMGPKWWKKAYIDSPRLVQKRPAGATEGMAIDTYLTEGAESFYAKFAIKPHGMKLNERAGIEWKLEHAGKEIMSDEDHEILLDVVDAVRNCCRWPMIEKSLAQRTIRRDQPALGIGLQSRPDWISPECGTIDDLKKCADLDKLPTQAYELGYLTQAAIGGWCAAGDGICIEHSYLVAGEWAIGARCRVYEIPHEILAHADREMRKLAAEVAERIATNNWTDNQEAPEVLPIPAWVERKMQSE